MFLIRLIDGINEIVGRIVVFFAAIFGAIIIYDVVMRYGFRMPSRWAFDVTKQLYGFYFIMLGGYALRHQAHVRVDLVTERLSEGVRRWVDVGGYLIFYFPFVLVFANESYKFALRSWNQGEMTYGAVQLPVYPVKIAMAVAAMLLVIQGVSELLKIILNKQQVPADVR